MKKLTSSTSGRSLRLKRASLILCLMMSFSGQAAIYQCPSKDGRLSFSDTPCSAGASKHIEDYNSETVRPYVSGRISTDTKSIPLRNGVVRWDAKKLTATIVLTRDTLSATHQQQVLMHDMSFLPALSQRGAAIMTLVFQNHASGAFKPNLENLISMRLNVLASTPNDSGLSRIIAGADISGHIDHLRTLNTAGDENTYFLQLSSHELSPDIRWNIRFKLPLKDATKH